MLWFAQRVDEPRKHFRPPPSPSKSPAATRASRRSKSVGIARGRASIWSWISGARAFSCVLAERVGQRGNPARPRKRPPSLPVAPGDQPTADSQRRQLVGGPRSPGQPPRLATHPSPVRLSHGLKQLRERDAQRPRQTKQVLGGRVPASGFNPAQVRPVHLGQFRQALLRQSSLAAQLPEAMGEAKSGGAGGEGRPVGPQTAPNEKTVLRRIKSGGWVYTKLDPLVQNGNSP
jgi:hypothetical protein